ncbi:MAG TPA: tetratricopeptide repeat protein [Bryobacteraceae bacterium]|nr:tetratricopeptide repeat protein [Bryobacteraceae bacterium]
MPASIALVVLFAFQAAPQPNPAEQGLKALNDKQYQAAADDFTRAVAADPKDYSLHFNLALAYSLLGKDAEAVPEYQKTLELKPGLYQAELNLGISLLREKRAADAVAVLTDAAAQKATEYRPHYYVADALMQAGEFAKAELAFTAALALDPKSPDAELGLAHALVKEQKLDDAAAHFKKAAELNANYRDDLLELGSLYEAAKKPEQAMAIYQQFPENPGAQERLGVLLLAAGKPADAIPCLQIAVAKSPTDANRAALAEAFLKSNQPEKALPVVEKILETTPNDFQIRMLYGRIIRDQRKFPEAAAQFELATKLKPDAPQAWSELAGVLVMAENYPAALAALDRVAALNAEKPGHIFLRAIVLDRMRDLKPALAAYQRFLSMSHGEFPNQEFQARQRAKILEREINR